MGSGSVKPPPRPPRPLVCGRAGKTRHSRSKAVEDFMRTFGAWNPTPTIKTRRLGWINQIGLIVPDFAPRNTAAAHTCYGRKETGTTGAGSELRNAVPDNEQLNV